MANYRFFLVAIYIAITDEDKKRLCNRGRRAGNNDLH